MTSPQESPRQRGGRPRKQVTEARAAPVVAAVDHRRRPLCPFCARPELKVNGAPRKSDGAVPLRCSFCGTTYLRFISLAGVL
jgi:hypothetical protein